MSPWKLRYKRTVLYWLFFRNLIAEISKSKMTWPWFCFLLCVSGIVAFIVSRSCSKFKIKLLFIVYKTIYITKTWVRTHACKCVTCARALNFWVFDCFVKAKEEKQKLEVWFLCIWRSGCLVAHATYSFPSYVLVWTEKK